MTDRFVCGTCGTEVNLPKPVLPKIKNPVCKICQVSGKLRFHFGTFDLGQKVALATHCMACGFRDALPMFDMADILGPGVKDERDGQ